MMHDCALDACDIATVHVVMQLGWVGTMVSLNKIMFLIVIYCRDKLDKMWLPAARRGTNFIKYSNQLKNTSLI